MGVACGGLTSVILENPYNLPLRLAQQGARPEDVLTALQEAAQPEPPSLRQRLEESGLKVIGEYGIGIFTEYLAERVMQAGGELVAQFQELEAVAATRAEYLGIARYWQIIARKE